MKSIPYLVFSGNCKTALDHYAKIFDGSIISLTTYRESPIPTAMELEERIFDSEFKAGELHFKASDDLPDYEVTKGSNISLFVSFSKQEPIDKIFSNLAKDGQILFPLDNHFGMLKDKFGIQWMMTTNSEI